jgi:hypothetical protein
VPGGKFFGSNREISISMSPRVGSYIGSKKAILSKGWWCAPFAARLANVALIMLFTRGSARRNLVDTQTADLSISSTPKNALRRLHQVGISSHEQLLLFLNSQLTTTVQGAEHCSDYRYPSWIENRIDYFQWHLIKAVPDTYLS